MAKRTKVKAHSRKMSSGRMIPVKQHTRTLSGKVRTRKSNWPMFDGRPVSSRVEDLMSRIGMKGENIEFMDTEHDEWGYKVTKIDFDDGSEYIIMDSDEAERLAIERVEDSFESEPSVYMDFLESYFYMTDTDTRIFAGEEVDAMMDNVDFGRLDEVLDILDMNVKELVENRDLFIDVSDALEDFMDMDAGEKADALPDLPNPDQYDERSIEAFLGDRPDLFSDDFLSQYVNPQDLDEKVRDHFDDNIGDSVRNDPVGYVRDNFGEESVVDLSDRGFFRIDFKEASKDAVQMDGMMHELDVWDGQGVDLDNGLVAFRVQ